jgi:hypothetical protein
MVNLLEWSAEESRGDHLRSPDHGRRIVRHEPEQPCRPFVDVLSGQRVVLVEVDGTAQLDHRVAAVDGEQVDPDHAQILTEPWRSREPCRSIYPPL